MIVNKKSMTMNRERSGIIRVFESLIPMTPMVFNKIGFAVIKAEYLYHLDMVEHTGVSRLFDKLTEGEKIPEYRLTTIERDGELSVEVERLT